MGGGVWLTRAAASRPETDLRFGAVVSALALGALVMLAPAVAASPVVAVLGSDLEPYHEALAGVREILGKDVPVLIQGRDELRVPSTTRIVVAIGGRAVLEPGYPRSAALVACLAPGVEQAASRNAIQVRVPMLPRPSVILSSLTEIHTGLESLAVLWISPGMQEHVRAMTQEAARRGISVRSTRLSAEHELPGVLRQLLRERPQAIWIPPDPLLLNRDQFATVRSFCQANRIPLYVPSEGLVEKGAVAAVWCDFRSIGRTAGWVVQQILGGQVPHEVFPERAELGVNVTAAQSSGLTLPPTVLRRAKVNR